MGRMSKEGGSIVFKGGEISLPGNTAPNAEVGLFICDQYFSGGSISADITFNGVSQNTSAGIIFNYDSQTQNLFLAALGSGPMYAVRHQGSDKWTSVAHAGPPNAIEECIAYHLEVCLYGSLVIMRVNDVEVIRTIIPIPLLQSQVGLFCINKSDIKIDNYLIEIVKPKAFVVMQFSSPYNEVYLDVIKNICEEEKIDVVRIDEASGPGLIIDDISKVIRESKLIIADISPVNANVFYEVGFAHALNKPTILIAEKGTSLPFDVSPFRTLFYENSIGGKRKLEEGLRKHIRASLRQPFE